MSITSYPDVTRIVDTRNAVWNPVTAASHSAFGEAIAIPITPVLQLDGLYGLPTEQFQTFTFGTGSVTSGLNMTCSTGTGAYGYGVLRSRRAVRYRPGQGALARFTAKFTSGVAGYTQRAGFFQQEQALQIGYNGTNFGVLRQNGGKAHIHRLTITTGAGGAETVTVTLNGTAFNIAVTSGGISLNAAQLGNASYSGWTVNYRQSEVLFLSNSVGPNAGSFSVSSTGTFAGTMSVAQTGVAHTDNWTYQSSFNVDKLDGTGPSGMVLDPTKLNVYQINFRWLGSGKISYGIENEKDGDIIYFHQEHYVNKNTTPHLDNPSLRIGYVVADLGGSGGTNVTLEGASILGAIEGNIAPVFYPMAVRGERTTNLSAGLYGHLLTLKNNLICNSKINVREVILKTITAGASSAASAPCTVLLYLEPTYGSTITYTDPAKTTSCISYSTTETTINGASFSPLFAFNITTGAPVTVDISDLRIVLTPNQSVAVAILSTGLLSRADASLTFIED